MKETKRFAFLLSIILIIGMMGYGGCGSDGGGGGGNGDTPTTTVSGTVLTANGSAINGAQVTITSTPVTTATDQNGHFSAVVEVGTHSIVIKRDTATIYTGTFTCSKDTPLDLGGISTIYAPLPDTGQTGDYTATFGEDSDYTINPPSYTGNGSTVTDNVTGLMWMKEYDNQTYNWYEASGTYNEAYNPGTTDVCGSSTFAGYSDWRLPDEFELMGIVDYGAFGPAIDSVAFPSTVSTGYWSSTTYAGNPTAWRVFFSNGTIYNGNKIYDYYVRCVRGGQSANSFNDNGDGTVTDNVTGLMWQQEDDDTERTWEQAISYCEALSLSTYSDWRLPNIKEVRSIVDSEQFGPAIDSTAFPNTISYVYWSSTTAANSPIGAWGVHFGDGGVDGSNKANYSYVRCLRGGQ
jgi:hypothetical protein